MQITEQWDRKYLELAESISISKTMLSEAGITWRGIPERSN